MQGALPENGIKKNPDSFASRYDLVLGNPPYGSHRGFYKGLGEEPRISRFEDYFAKRSLDVLKEGGIMAMVLPSGWLSRQKRLEGAELANAFRLPNGAFSGTGIGTDIVILKKNTHQASHDISDYFKKNPEKVLGEVTQRANQFGRLEDYVKGSLEDALLTIGQYQNRQSKFNPNTSRPGNATQGQAEKKSQIAFSEKPVSSRQGQPSTGNLFDGFPDAQDIKKSPESDDGQKLLDEARLRADETLRVLSGIKFKSVIIANEINFYNDVKAKLDAKEISFTEGELKKLIEKSEKIIKVNSKKSKEYLVQSSPEIKKGILKYQFKKNKTVAP